VKDRTNYGIGAEGKILDWELLPWQLIENSIRKLRRRIFRATREQKWNVVRSLMKLMLRSYFNLLESGVFVKSCVLNKIRRPPFLF